MAIIRVNITDKVVVRAVNTPGGPVYDFMDGLADDIEDIAFKLSPVNDPANAVHRGGTVGTYQQSWTWDRRGTGFHGVVRRIVNNADHAIFVEHGRSASRKWQVFSWTAWHGEVRYIRAAGPLPKRKGTRRQQRSAEGRLAVYARDRGIEFGGRQTGARAGLFILSKAGNRGLVQNGLAPGL